MFYINKKFHNTLLIILIVFSFLLFNKINFPEVSLVSNNEEEPAYTTLHFDLLKTFNMGNPKIISSYLWMITLLQADTKHTEENTRSWLYYRINAIAQLDPYFYENYLYGGLYLSIIKDDVYSARDIYTAGLKYYPNSLDLLWNYGFNECFELDNCRGAVEAFKKIISLDKNLRFKALPSVLAKILTSQDNHRVAFDILYNSYKNLPEGHLREKMNLTLYAIKSKIDLDCLNLNKMGCQTLDFDNNPYYLENGIYRGKLDNVDEAIRLRKKKRVNK